MQASDAKAFAELAYQFGPFFFALVFTLVVSRWTYTYYNKACIQQDCRDEDRRTYRWIFIGTTSFGMLLVVLSVIWWWNKSDKYVFRGYITELQQYEWISSRNLFFRSFWSQATNSAPSIHDEEFIIVQETPFSPNQGFDLYYCKGEGVAPVKCTIKYESSTDPPKYAFMWDTTRNATVLKRISEPPASGGATLRLPFFETALAQTKSKGSSGQIVKSPPTQGQLQQLNPYRDIVTVLQYERSGVGNKIAQLDRMAELDPQALEGVMVTVTGKEQMILTLMDLTRHTDRELASKAMMLCERVHVNRLVAERLQSKDAAIAADARKLIRRLDRYRAGEIMHSINTKASAQLQSLAKDVDAGRGFVTLIPTGSSEGDRYYVRVQWDPSNTTTVNRLTELFNRELVDRPSMKEEATFMKGRNERWVYWYSKEWAIHIAEEAAKCGGKATFATPVVQRASRSPWREPTAD